MSVTADDANRGSERAEVYGAAAPDYFRAGWQPLPLPPGCKQAPPSGYTGADGKMIGSIQTIKQWARNPKGAAGNVALHLLHPFVGIDVDTYGEKNGAASLAAAEAELGALPPTLISSARPDPLVSGIRVFRLPEGTPRLDPRAEERLTGRFGPDIDVISQSYRYIVAWPSTNPEADGAVYRWYAQHGDGSIGHPLAEVPTFAEVAELPLAWAQALTDGAARAEGNGHDPRAQARAQAVETALRSGSGEANPFDPADAELDELDIDTADAAIRLYSREGAEAVITEWCNKLASARRGRINDVLKDATSHLWHFVPHFLSAEEARAVLIEAQRQAWVASGGKDNGDYYQANRTIDHTVTSYVPAQVRFGLWWVAVEDDDEDDGAQAPPGKAAASAAAPAPTEATPDDDSDPTEIDDWDAPKPSASSSGAASSGAPSAASSGDRSSDRLGPSDQADIDAMLELRAKRKAEKQARAEAEQLAQMLTTERLRRQARAMVDEEESHRRVDPARKARLLADCLTSAQLDEIEPLEPLIDGWVFKSTLAQIFGPSGHYKSFVAADMARAVCTGEQWFGHETSKGKVLYVCAEGVQGFRARIRAIEGYKQLGRLEELTIVRRAVQIGGPEWAEFIEIIAEGGYVMVVVDTQARTTVGRKENDNTEMGEVVAALDELIEATGVGVVMIHHSGKGEAQDGRGASAIKGALQSQIRVTKRKGLTVEVVATKQKDHEELGPYFLQLEPFGDSLVVTADRVADGMAPDREEERKEEQRKLVHAIDANDIVAMQTDPAISRVIAAVFGGGMGGTKAEIKASFDDFLVRGGKDKSHRNTFNSAWTRLEKSGALLKNPAQARYVLSQGGCKAVGVEFERPAWVSEEEWEEALEEGHVEAAGRGGSDPAIRSGGPDDEQPWDAADDIEIG